MLLIDEDNESADWIKTLSWDLPTDPDDFLYAIGGRAKLDHFMTLPAAKAMPTDLKVALGLVVKISSEELKTLEDFAETKVRHVRDSEFWHLPVGTPIVPGMKPGAPDLAAVRGDNIAGVAKQKVKASQIKPGDFLDHAQTVKVTRVSDRNGQTTVSWKLKGGASGKQVFGSDSTVFIYRPATAPQEPAKAPQPTPKAKTPVEAPKSRPRGKKPTIKPPQDHEPSEQQVDEVAQQPTPQERAVSDAAARAAGAPEVEKHDDREVIEDMRTTYDIPEWRLHSALALIERANKRAARTGMDERFTYELERYEKKKKGTNGEPDTIEQRVKIKLNRPTLKRKGWTFVGTMQWDPEAGLITRLAPGEKLKKRPEAKRCDACGLARDRIDTYIVRGPDGEEKQVGTNCMETFLGIKPGALWALQWDDLGSQEGGEDDGWGHMGGGEVRYDPVNILAFGVAVTQEYGWVPRSKANDWGKPATVDVMMDVLYPPTKESNDQRRFREKILDMVRNGEKDDEAEAVLEFAKQMEGDNDYVMNLRAVAGATSVSMRNVALLISAIAAKQRAEGQRAMREAQAAQSVHVGNVGDKITGVKARVTGVQYIEGMYGVTTLISMVTPEGNVLKWFASGSKAYKIGDEVSIDRATIKKHAEWNGIKETHLTRAKLTVTKSAADEAKAFYELEFKMKHVRDAAFWGKPVGTPIVPGMKPTRLKPKAPKRRTSKAPKRIRVKPKYTPKEWAWRNRGVEGTDISQLTKEGQQKVEKDIFTEGGFTLEDLKNEIRRTAAKADMEKAKNWYPEAHAWCQDMSKKYNLPLDRVIGVVAAVSPRVRWEKNMVDAEMILDAVTNDEYFRDAEPDEIAMDLGCTALNKFVAEAVRIARGDMKIEDMGGAKRRSFFNNITAPGQTSDVTIDGWMQHALVRVDGSKFVLDDTSKLMKRGTNVREDGTSVVPCGSAYAALATAVRQVAEELGVSPDAVQSAYWIIVREEDKE